YQKALSALQSISTIRRRKGDRITIKEDSRGSKLKKLEDSIATLDNLQSKAVIETVEGVQRIRGLAGSGKTIVLALKAAYLHAQHPSWNIAVTFNTRSLKAQFRSLIYRFSVEQTGEEPDWSRIKVLNAWGAPGGEERDGLYHQFCKIHNASYFDFRTARSQFGKSNPFEMACSQAISSLDYTHSTEHSYNVILVDEAQDLPFSFLRLCYEFLDDKKRLVYAYDELQRLSEMSLAPPEEIFGRDSEGKPRVQFTEPLAGQPRPDIILEKCYRNSRPVLITAHALGFGIYRKSPLSQQIGLIQMFDNSTLWKDIGYEVSGGKLQDGLKVTLRRKPEASPDFLENHSNLEDLIQFLPFENELQQNEWLANSIERNLKEDELLPEDIIVINPDPLTTRKKVGEIRHILMQKGIRSHLAGVDTDPDVFFQTGSSITFTGIFRAKGNEAGMVYIINSQDCNSASQSLNLANIRNRLFTAITRSKAWIRVLGVGSGMINLIEEFKELEQNNFELSFQYPTKEERMRLSIVHRDTTVEEQKIINRRTKNLKDLIADVKSGRLYPEDIDEEDREQLIEILMSGKSQ
ncbi:MAG: ATP-binding domain-containing protein, partial [Cyanobacteria bacterium P01_G01_bin.54]